VQPAGSVTVSVSNGANPPLTASATVNVVASGQVTATAHPLVALYTITPPTGATVSIQFGTDTTYGLTTWSQPAAGGGMPLGTFVAGMRAQTLYHMRAVVKMSDGSEFDDSDHTFTTGAIPNKVSPTITVTTPNGMAPQPGVEMLDLLPQNGTPAPVIVTDMMG